MPRLRWLSLLLLVGWLVGCANAPDPQAIPPPPDSADAGAEAPVVAGIVVTVPGGQRYTYAPGETGRYGAGELLAFEAGVEGAAGADLRWDFGDGTTTEGPRPTHRYAEPGTYELVVTATAASLASSARYTLQIEAPRDVVPPAPDRPDPMPPPPALPAPVVFEAGQDGLSTAAAGVAARNAAWLARQGEVRVWLYGYAAAGEARPYRLAQRRAEAVRRAYVAAGLPAERVEVWSMSADARCRAACARVVTQTVTEDEWAASAPTFPAWPPPPPTSQGALDIRDVLGEDGRTLGDAADRLRRALDRLGYPRLGFYRLPGGFALATQIEQIEPDGRPKRDPHRFSLDIAPDERRSLFAMLRGFFTASPGYWRTVVFFVSALPIPAPEGELTATEAEALPGGGTPSLPDEIGDVPVIVPGQRSEFRCTVYVYEYHRASAEAADAVEPRSDGPLPVRRHLNALGFFDALR